MDYFFWISICVAPFCLSVIVVIYYLPPGSVREYFEALEAEELAKDEYVEVPEEDIAYPPHPYRDDQWR